MTPKQETVALFPKLDARVPKGRMGWAVPTPHGAKWGLIVNAAVLPRGRNSPSFRAM